MLSSANQVAKGNQKASAATTMDSILIAPHFHNEQAAYDYIEARLWPNGPVCPHCGNANPKRVYTLKGKTTRIGLRKCAECKKPFNVKLGTLFEGSHCPLHIWLQAIQLMYSSKQYISSRQLQSAVSVSKRAAWVLVHRIRGSLGSKDDLFSAPANGGIKTVEVDKSSARRER